MKKAILAAAIAALPLMAFGSQFVADEQPLQPVPAGETSLTVEQPPAQGCCLVYFMGRWYCVPC